MDDGVRKWIARTARKNFWRVHSFYELDDLIQDGYICYLRVRAKYPSATKPAHIMRLTQITFLNYIQDLARRRTTERRVLMTEALCSYAMVEQEPHVIMQSAPEYVQRFFRFMQSDGPEKLQKPFRSNHKGRGRETSHRRLCRMLALRVNETPELPQAIAAFIEQ